MANRLVVGDPNLPLPGTTIEDVPNGTFDVRGQFKRIRGEIVLASFRIVFAEDGIEQRSVHFSIDSGIVCVARPRLELKVSTAEFKEARKKLWRQVMQHQGPYFSTLIDPEGEPWAVIAPVLDDIYDLQIRSNGRSVTDVSCNLLRSAKLL